MAETLYIPENASRKEVYESIIPQIEGLLNGETDQTANLANFAAALKEAFGFFWVGFYLKKENQLVLGPFQGRLLVRVLILIKVFVGIAIARKKRSLCQMSKSFLGILLVVPLQNLKLYCLFLIKMVMF